MKEMEVSSPGSAATAAGGANMGSGTGMRPQERRGAPTYGDERAAAKEIESLRRRARTAHDTKRPGYDLQDGGGHSPEETAVVVVGAGHDEVSPSRSSPAMGAGIKDLAALMNLVAHTNYPAMLELFKGSGAPPAGSVTDVNVSFELFESVQKRSAATREELDKTKIDLVSSNRRIVQLQTDTGVLKDKVGSLERQLKEAEEYNQQLRQLSTDAALLQAQHEMEMEALKTEYQTATDRIQALNKQLQDQTFKLSDTQVALAQRDSLITNLKRERDDLQRKLRSKVEFAEGSGGEGGGGGKIERTAALSKLRDAAHNVGTQQQINTLRHSLVEVENARKEGIVELRKAKAKFATSVRRRVVDAERNERRIMYVHDVWSAHTCPKPPSDVPEVVVGRENAEGEPRVTAESALLSIQEMSKALKQRELNEDSRFFQEFDMCKDSTIELTEATQESLRLMKRFQTYMDEALTIHELKASWTRVEHRWFRNVRELAAEGFQNAALALDSLSAREDAIVAELDKDVEQRWKQRTDVAYMPRQVTRDAQIQTDSASFLCGLEDRSNNTDSVRGIASDVDAATQSGDDYGLPEWVERLEIPPEELRGRPRELYENLPKHLLLLHVRIVELGMALRKILGITAGIADPTTFLKKLNVVPTIKDAYEIIHFDGELLNTLLSSLLLSKDEATQRLLNYKRKIHHYAMERTIEEQQQQHAPGGSPATTSPASTSARGSKGLDFSDRQQVAEFKMRRQAIESDIDHREMRHGSTNERLQLAVEDHLYADESSVRQQMAVGSQTAPRYRHGRASSKATSGGTGSIDSTVADGLEVSAGEAGYSGPGDTLAWDEVRGALAWDMEALETTTSSFLSSGPGPTGGGGTLSPGGPNGSPTGRSMRGGLSPATTGLSPRPSPLRPIKSPLLSPATSSDRATPAAAASTDHKAIKGGVRGHHPSKSPRGGPGSPGSPAEEEKIRGRERSPSTIASKSGRGVPVSTAGKRPMPKPKKPEGIAPTGSPVTSSVEGTPTAGPRDKKKPRGGIDTEHDKFMESITIHIEKEMKALPSGVIQAPHSSWESSHGIRSPPQGSIDEMERRSSLDLPGEPSPRNAEQQRERSSSLPAASSRRREGSIPPSPRGASLRSAEGMTLPPRRASALDSGSSAGGIHQPPKTSPQVQLLSMPRRQHDSEDLDFELPSLVTTEPTAVYHGQEREETPPPQGPTPRARGSFQRQDSLTSTHSQEPVQQPTVAPPPAAATHRGTIRSGPLASFTVVKEIRSKSPMPRHHHAHEEPTAVTTTPDTGASQLTLTSPQSRGLSLVGQRHRTPSTEKGPSRPRTNPTFTEREGEGGEAVGGRLQIVGLSTRSPTPSPAQGNLLPTAAPSRYRMSPYPEPLQPTLAVGSALTPATRGRGRTPEPAHRGGDPSTAVAETAGPVQDLARPPPQSDRSGGELVATGTKPVQSRERKKRIDGGGSRQQQHRVHHGEPRLQAMVAPSAPSVDVPGSAVPHEGVTSPIGPAVAAGGLSIQGHRSGAASQALPRVSSRRQQKQQQPSGQPSPRTADGLMLSVGPGGGSQHVAGQPPPQQRHQLVTLTRGQHGISLVSAGQGQRQGLQLGSSAVVRRPQSEQVASGSVKDAGPFGVKSFLPPALQQQTSSSTGTARGTTGDSTGTRSGGGTGVVLLPRAPHTARTGRRK